MFMCVGFKHCFPSVSLPLSQTKLGSEKTTAALYKYTKKNSCTSEFELKQQ